MRGRLLGSSYLARYALLNAVGLDDYRVFPERRIGNAVPRFDFGEPPENDALAPILEHVMAARSQSGRTESLDESLRRNQTTAFLVIRHDRLLYERYFNGHARDSICTSFSVAKSFSSAMIGIALHEKLIGQIDDPLTRYLPELKDRQGWAAITIRHLVSMSSGLAYNSSSFFPWSDEPRTYYSLDLRRVALNARPVETPGLRFVYNNYNLLLLGMLLERVTGGPVSAYLQEKVWKPLGMEWNASWSLDSERSGMEKMESGLNARAVDFAKFGRLYLRRGDWDGQQIIPEEWILESTTPWSDGRWPNYKYLWWIPRSGKGRFMAVGNLGQFIYVAPDKDCLILRFGAGKPKDWRRTYVELFRDITDEL
ncbi:MAG TPA: serine hydrolase [Anaerolineales bacterium]|nr:serine hydrolase [Anaerolineales bacterium]